MLVTNDKLNFKITLFRNAQMLKPNSEKYQNITMSHDMIKSEREEGKKMYAEAKKRENKSKGEIFIQSKEVHQEPGKL